MPPSSAGSKTVRRARGRAPVTGTPVAVAYLRAFVEGHKNRAMAASKLLGCSKRTALRLLSVKRPYKARIKADWAYLICAAVGKPAIHVLGSKGARLFPHAIVGWHLAKSKSEQIEMASDCAAMIATQASIQYDLNGLFSIHYAGGWVRKVIILLSPVPDVASMVAAVGSRYGFHRIILTCENDVDGVMRTRVRHVDPLTGGSTDNEILTAKHLEKIIQDIYALTKNISAELLREAQRGTQ